MADTAIQELPNSVQITDAGPSRKKITIEIPAETVSQRLKSSMDLLAADAQMPGFRKGKAPRGLIERKFGDAVKSEAKQQLVSQAYSKAIEEHKLKVVGEPTSEMLPKVELASGKPLSFELEVEVLPEFTLPSLDGINVIRPTLAVADEMIDKEVQNLRINEGDLESRDVAEPGDYVTGHAVMKDDKGTEFYNIKGAVVQAPPADKGAKGMILGILVDDFSKQMGKPKAGETFTVKTKGPEQHEIEGIRGASLTITFAAERVDRILPAAIEKVCQTLGMQSEQQLRDAIRTRLEQRVGVQQQVAMRSQVAKHLSEQVKMDLPQRLTAQQAVRTLERRRLELMYRGVELTKIEERMAELRSSSAAMAASDLKMFFILNRAAEDLGIQVNEMEVNNRIAQMAFERNLRPDKLRQELIKNNQVNGIVQQIREHKTFDQILSKAVLSEMPAEEYNKKMAGQDEHVG